MDRLASLFEQLSLPEVAHLLRWTALSGLGVGIVALGISIAFSHPLAGLGACCGLGLGLMNIRYVTRSVTKLVDNPVDKPRRVLAGRSLGRLGVTTIIVIGMTFLSDQLGLGAFAGIGLFYFVLIVNVARSLLRSRPRIPA